MTNDYMYRARILEQPEWEEYEAFDERDRGYGPECRWETWHRPAGWVASADYVERHQSDKFFEPNTDRWFKSRFSAASRVSLLRSMGYEAIVQRSAPVVWPSGAGTKVDVSESQTVLAAIKTLVRAGVVKSADDLL